MSTISLQDFCEKIGLSADAISACTNYKMQDEDYVYFKNLLSVNKEQFVDEIGKLEDAPIFYLAFCVRAAQELLPVYAEKNISETVFYETFADLARWETAHYEKSDTHGISECEWLTNHLTCGIFHLGTIQFQPNEIPDEIKENQSLKNMPCFNLHIPKGADLSPDAIDNSIKKALDFFKCNNAVMLCGSWLLSPALHNFLDENSKILAYNNRFTIYSFDESEDFQAEERIFDKIDGDYANYPETTSLQKKAKQWLLSGNKIPFANGYFVV